MKSQTHTFLIISMLLGGLIFHPLFAQDTLHINFPPTYHFPSKDGHGYMPLKKIKGKTVDVRGQKYEITYPENFLASDTAFSTDYFTGWKGSKLAKGTGFLFANYKSFSPTVYVDYNHNLDFSDDGLPMKFQTDSTATVFLRNSEKPGCYFPLKFFYLMPDEDGLETLKMFFVGEGATAEERGYVPMKYWMGDKRMTTRIAHTQINGQSVKIGLQDYDCNGLYNNAGKDLVMIGNYEKDYISEKKIEGAVTYEENVQLLLAGVVYEVVEIEPSGSFIRLVKSNKPYVKPITEGDYIGDLEVELVSGAKKSLAKLQEKDKYLLLEFWGSWCAPCTAMLPTVKELQEETSKKLQVIGMNYGDGTEKAQAYIDKHQIKWKNAIASEEIIKKLSIEGFPSFILLNPEGKIEKMGIYPGEVKELLK